MDAILGIIVGQTSATWSATHCEAESPPLNDKVEEEDGGVVIAHWSYCHEIELRTEDIRALQSILKVPDISCC